MDWFLILRITHLDCNQQFVPKLEELKQMFIMYDKDKSGTLDLKEVLTATKAVGYDQDEVMTLISEADTDKDSVISFDEFVQLMKFSYI